MELYTNAPYWLMKDGIVDTYTSLSKNITADIAIMGAGISAALIAYSLRNSGLSIAVADRRHVGMGSTAASTAFLQYEIDTPMTKLTKMVGEENAVKSYRLCRKAIYDIGKICDTLKPSFDFHMRPSLQYASFLGHARPLHEEYEMRKRHGFAVNWLEPKDIMDGYGITAPGAICSEDGGEVNAYLLTCALMNAVKKSGHSIHTNTNVTNIEHHRTGVTLQTESGPTIKAKKLIIACGYESMRYLPKKIGEIHTTYALVSEPVTTKNLWRQNSLVWETAQPYMYFRRVGRDRIILGGRDDKFHRPHTLASTVKKKTAMLQQAFSKRMPHVTMKPDFSWSGAFAVTKDGLPYIGSIPQRPHTIFALGFGGNGITFSAIAADMIHNILLKKKDPDLGIFSFDR